MATLLLEQEDGLSKGKTTYLRAGLVVESLCSLDLEEYIRAQNAICAARHDKHCTKCLVLLSACSKILSDGMCSLGTLWRFTNSRAKYQSDKAKRTFLQLPLAFISCIGKPGSSQVYVMAKKDIETYELIARKIKESTQKDANVDHTALIQELILIAESEAERERIKFAASAVCNASRREAKKFLGVTLGRRGKRAENVAQAVESMKVLKESIEEMKEVEIQARFGEKDETGVHNASKADIRRINNKYRLRLKALSSKHRSRRKSTKNVNNMIAKFPGIGKAIEDYAHKCDVGADRWRRTGLNTFGGEKKCEKRLTFEKLRRHLMQLYGRHFSIGTVAELCVPHNQRRRSSKRYHAAAKLRFQRAWKGYNNKLNPDDHWSRAMYRLLDILQKKTAKSILMGRDDQAGFRLDSTFTHKQYPSLSVDKTITTHTDFLNKNATNLQITSYNFPETEDNVEVCVGVVKGSQVHQKNPSQHMADLIMLEKKPELAHLFVDQEIEFIRVDGAVDEGPSHLEVQFLWTERHLAKKRKVTVVTSRCSGDSYLNRVELQNSHLTKGHSNTFIPSTLQGANTNEAGDFDVEKFKANIREAINVYISRVNHTPAMGTTINLYPGVENSVYHHRREALLTFLKGTKVKKEALKRDQPLLYKYFSKIWKLRDAHMVDTCIPIKYMFMLRCCGSANCIHPACTGNALNLQWYPGGPSIERFLPTPVIEIGPSEQGCVQCFKDHCPGHYKECLHENSDSAAPVPTVLITEELAKDVDFDVGRYKAISKECIVRPQVVQFYVQHLKQVKANRERGSEKAKATRLAKAKVQRN